MDFSDPYDEFDPDPSVEGESGSARRSRRPDRTRRSRGSGGSGGGQNVLARRAIALGVGLLVLILLVIGAKGCLDARKNRSLDDYSNSVTQIVDETNTLGESFYGRLDDPGDLTVTDFTAEIESDRSAMAGFLSRVEKLDTPGDMKSAQDTLTLVYQLRSGAMDAIADRMSTALGDKGRDKAVQQIAKQMQVLSAADVLYNQVTRHQIDFEIESNGASAAPVPVSTFVPDPVKWGDSAEIDSALGGVAGGSATPTDGGVHGTGLGTVSIGGTTLDPSATTQIPSGTEPVVDVEVQNQGDSNENDIEVSATVGGDTLTESISSLAAGETGTASILLTPAPSGEVTLEVKVAAVPGEQVLDNNEATYSVSFG
ncbi:MAG: hypothetical protein KDB62_09345 [Solirubrobacterales bacterium]|nr:hypothetical protein [Solirubrobacterales bacterium]